MNINHYGGQVKGALNNEINMRYFTLLIFLDKTRDVEASSIHCPNGYVIPT